MSDYSELKLLTQCVGALLMLQARQAYLMDHDELCAVKQFTQEANPVTVLRLIEDIEKLKAESDSLRKDAERYQWLRANGGKKFSDPIPGIPATGVLYDIAVDHLMGAGDKA